MAPGTSFYSGAFSPATRTSPIDNTDYELSDAFKPTGATTQPERSLTGGATAPDPGAGSNPFAPPGSSAATPGAGSSQPGTINDPYAPLLKHLSDASQTLRSAYSAPHAGAARQIFGALLSRKNPALGGLVSGETQRNRGIEQAQEDYGIASSQITAARAQQNQIVENNLKNAQATEATSKGAQATAEAAALPAKQALEAAQAEAANYKPDGNGNLIDIRTKQPITDNLAPLNADEAAVLGKNPGDRVPLKLKNTANEIVNRGKTTVNTEGGVYERDRQKGTMTRLGDNPRMMFAPSEQYTDTLDPNDPSKVILQKKGAAAASGAALPQSAEGITARATAKAVAPGGKVGEEINAYNTAIQHGDLLKKAITSLGNGDIQTLNGLKNSFQNEFGVSGPVTAQAISDAYTREVTKMLSSGHLTDSEIGTIGKTLDPQHQSPQQMNSVINAYQALASSKMKVRQQGVEEGMHGRPNFGGSSAPAAGVATHVYNPATGQIEEK